MTAAEEWRPVVGYEGIYEVSSLGRVRTIKPNNAYPVPKLKKTQIAKTGYHEHSLWKGGRAYRVLVHCLVAEAFIGARPTGKEVNHIDGNKANNTPENLEYVTPKENRLHAVRLGLAPTGERCGAAKLTAIKVEEIRHALGRGTSRASLARKYGVSWPTIDAIFSGHTWHHSASSANDQEGAPALGIDPAMT